MTTTAQFRNEALKFERLCDWASAAAAWQKAINVYPGRGALAELDIKKMTARNDSCKQSAAFV